MSDMAAVMAALPGDGNEIRSRLGWTHEQTYRALVRLYDRGMVRITTAYKHRRRAVWEQAEDEE